MEGWGVAKSMAEIKANADLERALNALELARGLNKSPEKVRIYQDRVAACRDVLAEARKPFVG